MGTAQKQIKEPPRIQARWRSKPNVRSLLAPINLKTDRRQFATNNSGILHIKINQCLHLALAIGGVHGFRTPLNNITNAIKLSALTTVP